MEGSIFAVVYLIFIAFILYRVIRIAGRKSRPDKSDRVYKKPASNIRPASNEKPASYVKPPADASVSDRPVTLTGTGRGSSVNRLMDDREHDWLARQLAEERAAKRRMSDMFELKREHAANCDAHSARLEHERDCDAEGIDTAKAR